MVTTRSSEATGSSEPDASSLGLPRAETVLRDSSDRWIESLSKSRLPAPILNVPKGRR